MKKIVFIGDSIFDNKAFVGDGECHLDCAKRLLPDEYEPILIALDGSITLDTIKQLERVPEETEVIVVSAGGNDAINSLKYFLPDFKEEIEEYKSDVIKSKKKLPKDRMGGISNMMFMNVVNKMSPEIYALNKFQESFHEDYYELCEELNKLNKRIIVCTIYNSTPTLSPILKTILSVFNDMILATASDFGFDVLDLRKICIDPEDYSAISPIEPSSKGSEKINNGLFGILSNEKNEKQSMIYPRII